MNKNIIPTKEQEEIIQALPNNNVLKINAFAGTGKTSTLQMLTNYYATKKFLYLAYNKSIELEAKKKFGRNVEVKTVHALAYKHVASSTNLNLKKIINHNAKSISNIFNVDYKTAKQILLSFSYYCNSSEININLSSSYSNYVKIMIEKIENKEMNISFDYILKKFQLLLSDGLNTTIFDTVMLDEAQDSNDVTLDIFNRLNSNHKVLVGDKHQQIYSFRESTNAMTKINGKELALTKTFRFPKNIASYSNILLSRFKNEVLKISSDKIETDFDIAYNDKSNTVGFISRGNASLIATMKKLSNDKDKYKTVRQPKEIFLTMKDIGYFLDKKKSDISTQNNFLKSLKSRKDLEDYIAQTKDYQLEINLKIYDSIFNNSIEELIALENEATHYFKSNGMFRYYLTTAHTSKGLEFDLTFITSDFFQFETIICKMGYLTYEEFLKDEKNHSKLFDEFNLLYVAITRCKLNSKIEDGNLKYLIEDNWKNILNENLFISNKQYGCNK